MVKMVKFMLCVSYHTLKEYKECKEQVQTRGIREKGPYYQEIKDKGFDSGFDSDRIELKK